MRERLHQRVRIDADATLLKSFARGLGRAMFLRGRSADAVEGVTSFLEKRPATYPDRVSDGLPDLGLEEPQWS